MLSHPSAVTFNHDNGDLILQTTDIVYFRHSQGNGDAMRDVCITFAFHVFVYPFPDAFIPSHVCRTELKDPVVEARFNEVQQAIIGDKTLANSAAPIVIQTEDGEARGGATALERDPRSKPLEGAPRAIPLSLSVEGQRGGLHAPTAGNEFSNVGVGMEAQDPGLHLRNKYVAVRIFFFLFFPPARVDSCRCLP
jgi:hypothetical protein